MQIAPPAEIEGHSDEGAALENVLTARYERPIVAVGADVVDLRPERIDCGSF